VTEAPAPLLRIEGVGRAFDGVPAVSDVSLDVREGEFFTLLGASGSGKTTLLRIVAGLERADAGRVLIGGIDVTDVPPYARPVNMMFQSYALFPHMTVAGNVAFGLRQENLAKTEIAARVRAALDLVQMGVFAGRRPDQLSGGQSQRVALARALVKQPRLLLLDEPLAALDARLREETRLELVNIQKRVGVGFLMVTHDQAEAMTVSDRVAVMDEGRILQIGRPAEVYEAPRSRFVARFVGAANLIEGHVVGRAGPDLAVHCGEAGVLLVRDAGLAAAGSSVALVVRPEKISLAPPADAAAREAGVNRLPVRVLEIAYRGGATTFNVEAEGGLRIRVEAANRARGAPSLLAVGDRADACWPAEAGVAVTE
jgi:putrescine transport system ATP-binding protein